MPRILSRYLRVVTVLWQVLWLAFATPAGAEALAEGPNHITASLVAERSGAPGETIDLAILMKPAPKWHGYWLNPGDAGFGMKLDWTLPAGAKAGAVRYPVPETLLIYGLMNHVYEHDYALIVPLTLPADAKRGAVLPVKVDAQWLACTDTICVPEKATLTGTVTIGPGGARDARFDGWRMRLPAPLGAQARFALTDKAVRIAIPLPASVPLDKPHLFAESDRVVAYAGKQDFRRQGDLLVVTLERAAGGAAPAAFPAVLRLNGAGDGLAFGAAPGLVPEGGALVGGEEAPALSLGWLLLAALAGGLLLNVMPCVFPILSLKALSLARAGESAKGARIEGVAYAAGVIVACLMLGGLLLGLRAAGEQVGWAFQLQEPLVVAALLALAAAITANLLGVFEFAVPGFVSRGGGGHGAAGAFLTGLLAAFVATPCTGPFMATAMGAALLLPVPAALALFATLGLGIALPFLALAFIPALRRRLPKPGGWMNTFRKAMAVPMALTALALLWLASRLGGWPFAIAAAAVTAVLLVLLAGIGREQRAGRAAGRFALAAVAVALVAGLALPYAKSAPVAEDGGLLGAKPWSEAAVAAARAAHKPVFAYFTADWCLTCKVNEKAAIETEATRAAFAKAGVVVLRGDWTRRDPAITATLTAHQAAGVPLYLWYPADGAPERVLPQVLTSGLLAGLPAAK